MLVMLIETDLCLSPEEIWVRIKVQRIMNRINAEIHIEQLGDFRLLF